MTMIMKKKPRREKKKRNDRGKMEENGAKWLEGKDEQENQGVLHHQLMNLKYWSIFFFFSHSNRNELNNKHFVFNLPRDFVIDTFSCISENIHCLRNIFHRWVWNLIDHCQSKDDWFICSLIRRKFFFALINAFFSFWSNKRRRRENDNDQRESYVFLC